MTFSRLTRRSHGIRFTMEIKFTIPLKPVTKKNSQRIIPVGKKDDGTPVHRIVQSKQYLEYEEAAGWLIPYKGKNISSPCEVQCLFYMPSHHKVDLTNLLAAIDDILVKYKVLADDNCQIIVSHDGSRVLYDKEHPRTDVTIKTL